MATKKPYVVHSDRTWLQAEKDLKALFKSWGVTDFDIRREGSACAVTWYPAGAARRVEYVPEDAEIACHELAGLTCETRLAEAFDDQFAVVCSCGLFAWQRRAGWNCLELSNGRRFFEAQP